MTAGAATIGGRDSQRRAFLAVLRRDLYVTWRELPAFLAQVVLQPLFLLFVFGKVLGSLGYTQHGYADLHERVLRTPTEPERLFKDAPLRMLRAARVAARTKGADLLAVQGARMLVAGDAVDVMRDLVLAHRAVIAHAGE